jgi:hypothetical protein
MAVAEYNKSSVFVVPSSEVPGSACVNMPDVGGNSNHTFMQSGADHWKSSFLDTYSSIVTAHAPMTASSDDWRQITDSAQRKKVQNRIAQRTYREPTIP